MASIPPWRWSLWGPWPPGKTNLPWISEDEIRPLAALLSKQRPWLSADENWLAAERALRQKPWRPWVIRFSGEKERSGWDWASLLLVPVLLSGLTISYNLVSGRRQEKIVREQKEFDVASQYMKEMKSLMLDKELQDPTRGALKRSVARSLTMSTLLQINNPETKTLVARFLVDSDLNATPGHLISLRWANLRNSDLNGSNLRKVDLRWADLAGANLGGAFLEEADLRFARLSGADFRRAFLSRANLYSANVQKNGREEPIQLSGAILRKADLSMADLHGANLSKADLTGANLGSASILKGQKNPRGADLSAADLSHATLNGADLSEANLREANLIGVNLSGANLSKADLKDVKWNDTTRWPEPSRFDGAKNIPKDLKKQLGF